MQWINVGGSDVCLPRDTKKPLSGPRFNGVVHFIGGVFVGTVPKLAYGPFIERLVRKGRLVVVATPVQALTGMDHYKAAYEAAFRFTSACTALKGELGEGVFDADDYPTVGVAHSLGCKVQCLMGAVDDARAAAGRPRAANVHLAFNNFDAKQSIPVLDQLREASEGLAAAAPVLERISDAAETLRKSDLLRGVLQGREAEQAFSFLDTVTGLSRAAAERARDAGIAEDFSPGPDDTLQLIRADYAVARNLCVKFLEDDIDQSVPLCTVLRDKFTGPSGSGGRLDLRRLGGSHVTPNTPEISPDDLGANFAAGAAIPGFQDMTADKAREVVAQLEEPPPPPPLPYCCPYPCPYCTLTPSLPTGARRRRHGLCARGGCTRRGAPRPHPPRPRAVSPRVARVPPGEEGARPCQVRAHLYPTVSVSAPCPRAPTRPRSLFPHQRPNMRSSSSCLLMPSPRALPDPYGRRPPSRAAGVCGPPTPAACATNSSSPSESRRRP